MSEPFIGQIEIFSFGFAPRGWAQCNGQLMPIAQNQALFALLGTAFGGDGMRTFALPNLQGRIPMGQGNGPGRTPRSLGQLVGEDNHTLSANETPPHTHDVAVISNVGTATNTQIPGPTVALAKTAGVDTSNNPITLNVYGGTQPNVSLAPSAIGNAGGQPHSNMMPSLGVNFCIALQGIFPSRN